jgi:hypothetical protein
MKPSLRFNITRLDNAAGIKRGGAGSPALKVMPEHQFAPGATRWLIVVAECTPETLEHRALAVSPNQHAPGRSILPDSRSSDVP